MFDDTLQQFKLVWKEAETNKYSLMLTKGITDMISYDPCQ